MTSSGTFETHPGDSAAKNDLFQASFVQKLVRQYSTNSIFRYQCPLERQVSVVFVSMILNLYVEN